MDTPNNPPILDSPGLPMGWIFGAKPEPRRPSNVLYADFARDNSTRAPRDCKARLSREISKSVWRAAVVVRRGISSAWAFAVANGRRAAKELAVKETAALGDRRFVAVVQFQQQRFLIGSSPAAVTLLAALPDAPMPPSSQLPAPEGAAAKGATE